MKYDEARKFAAVHNRLAGNQVQIARELKRPRPTIQGWLREIEQKWPKLLKVFPKATGGNKRLDGKDCQDEWAAFEACGYNCALAASKIGMAEATLRARIHAYADTHGINIEALRKSEAGAQLVPGNVTDLIRDRLRRGPATLEELKAITGLGDAATRGMLDDMRAAGINLHSIGGKWGIEKTPPPREAGSDARHTLTSTPDNRFVFGFVTDNHIGSKYARLDVLHDLYDRFERRGVTHVYNAGNWIDGERRFNRFDLLVNGMDSQLRYLAEKYPKRNGIKTYFVAGDDHEGWYAQDSGVDIGRYAENKMRDAGRDDFVYLGYIEADVALKNSNTGKMQRMRVVHPGGGSAYAISYSMQKFVESLEGGDKPAVVLGGHYHKMFAFNYRNVWIYGGGTTEDQTPFMRKGKMEAHVGGILVELEQDERTGAIIVANGQHRYFDRGHYGEETTRDERYSLYGPVKHRERSLGGV